MKRIISIVLASAMTATCAACLSGCGGGASADSADAGEVNVYNWGEYISNGEDDSLDIIEEFEKIGLDTARSVLKQDVADLVRRTDLEEETIMDVMNILKTELEG